MTKQKPQVLLKRKYNSICKKLESLPSVEVTPFKTDGKASQQYESISRINDVPLLIELHSHVLGRFNAYNNSKDMLKIDVEPYKHKGFSLDDWNHDFKLQIEIVQNEDLRRKLVAAKKKIEPYLDKDQQIEELLKTLEV